MTGTANKKAVYDAFGEVVDQRAEIKANDIEVTVKLPGNKTVELKLDASRYTSTGAVADEVRAMLLRLLEA